MQLFEDLDLLFYILMRYTNVNMNTTYKRSLKQLFQQIQIKITTSSTDVTLNITLVFFFYRILMFAYH